MSINRRVAVLLVFLFGVVALATMGVFQNFYLSLMMMTQDWQRLFHDEVAGKLRLIKETHSIFATMSLIFIGFLYGALHAVGPGHGKVVVSSYLLASKSSLKRGLVITFLASIMQACVAVLVVFGLTTLFGLTRGAAQEAAVSLENVSFGLILLIGAVLLWRGGKEFWHILHPTTNHEHHHDHEHSCSCGCCCGHAPHPNKLEKADGWASLAALIFSIGLRPCSGALLLLLFADLIGVYTAGVFATFAMAIGTAITTGLLAVLTVQSKALALRLTQSSGNHLRFLHAGFSIVGGLLIIMLGSAFLQSNAMASGFSALNDGVSATQNHPLMKGFSGVR